MASSDGDSYGIGFKFQFGSIIYEVIEINTSCNYHKCKQISNDNDWPLFIFLEPNQLNFVSSIQNNDNIDIVN